MFSFNSNVGLEVYFMITDLAHIFFLYLFMSYDFFFKLNVNLFNVIILFMRFSFYRTAPVYIHQNIENIKKVIIGYKFILFHRAVVTKHELF